MLIRNVSFFRISYLSSKLLHIAFFIKILTMISFYLTYTFYYKDRKTSDMYRYFDDSMILFSSIKENPIIYMKILTGLHSNVDSACMKYYFQMNNWYKSYDYMLYNDNRTVIRLNALIRLFSFGSIHIHGLIFAILGFLGCLFLFKTLEFHDNDKNKLFFILLFFYPSLVFWTSHISKESLFLFSLGGFLYSIKTFFSTKKIRYLIFIIIFGSLMTIIKSYVLLIIIVVLPGFILSKFKSIFPVFIRYTIAVASIFLVLGSYDLMFNDVQLIENFVRRQHDFIHFARSVKAGSLLNVQFLEPNIWSLLFNMPKALVNTLIRPFFLDAHNIFTWLLSLENLFLIFLVILMFLFSSRIPDKSLFWGCFYFFLITSIFLGLSTPVLGALSRYKIIALPFIFYCIVSLIDVKKASDKSRILRIWKK